jgi:hypothetical protein
LANVFQSDSPISALMAGPRDTKIFEKFGDTLWYILLLFFLYFRNGDIWYIVNTYVDTAMLTCLDQVQCRGSRVFHNQNSVDP